MDIMWALNDPTIAATLQHLVDDETATNTPSRAYARDRKAMARTPADIKELPKAYVFEVDMPGINCSEIKVTVQEDKTLVISGERRREDDKAEKEGSGAKYQRMERPMGKFMRKFPLPENANVDAVSAACKDGVLTVTVEKVSPPEPKKPKTIQVQVA